MTVMPIRLPASEGTEPSSPATAAADGRTGGRPVPAPPPAVAKAATITERRPSRCSLPRIVPIPSPSSLPQTDPRRLGAILPHNDRCRRESASATLAATERTGLYRSGDNLPNRRVARHLRAGVGGTTPE